MRGFVVGTIVTAIAFFVLTKVLPDYVSFDYDGDLVELHRRPGARSSASSTGSSGRSSGSLALPITLMTMGLVGFVINAGLLLLTALDRAARPKFDLKVGDFPPDLLTVDTFVAAIVGAVVLSLVSTAVRLVIPD